MLDIKFEHSSFGTWTSKVYLHIGAHTKGVDEEYHCEEVGEPDLCRLPELWPEIIVCFRVVEDVDPCRAEEREVDEADDAELDWRIPVEEQVLKQ